MYKLDHDNTEPDWGTTELQEELADVPDVATAEPDIDGAHNPSVTGDNAFCAPADWTEYFDDDPLATTHAAVGRTALNPSDESTIGGPEDVPDDPSEAEADDSNELKDAAPVTQNGNDDIPPIDASESGEATGDWLPKFDMDTPLLDVLTRPSAFNPHPDRAAGGMEVLDVMEPTGNPRITVKYTESDTATGAVLPLSEVAPPSTAEDYDDTSLIPAEEMDRHIVAAGVPDANWIPMDRYWAGLSADLAHTHILQEDGAAAVEEVKALAVAHSDMDEPFDTGYGKYVHTRPQEFVQAGIAAAQAATEAGNPARGYALASETFRGFSYPIGNNTDVSNSAFLWITEKDGGMASHLFPALAEPWSALPQGRISGPADPWYIGRNATAIVKGELMGDAVEKWLGANSDTASPAAVEKAWLLRERINNEVQTAEAKLRDGLEVARQQYRGDAWQAPNNLRDYLLNRLTS